MFKLINKFVAHNGAGGGGGRRGEGVQQQKRGSIPGERQFAGYTAKKGDAAGKNPKCPLSFLLLNPHITFNSVELSVSLFNAMEEIGVNAAWE